MPNPVLAAWVRFAFSQGWTCVRSHTRGSGHEARDAHAKSPYRPTLEECLEWVDGGQNIEVLLHESDLLQVDAEHGAPAPWIDPAAHGTIIAASASGGLHAIYLCPPGLPKRRTIKPVPLVDLLTKGVWPLPGCRRDGDARKPTGEWRPLCDPFPPAAPPEWVLAPLAASHPRIHSPAPTGHGYARKALASEAARLAAVPEGAVNDALNTSAYRMGQLATALEREEAVCVLCQAAVRSNYDDRKSRDTAERAFDRGAKEPRAVPVPLASVTVELVTDRPVAPLGPPTVPDSVGHVCRTVLVPGAHLDSDGEYHEQGHEAFAAGAFEALPPGALYRRDTVVGQVVGARFHPADEHDVSRLVDLPNVRLGKWIKRKGDEGTEQAMVYENCSPREAQLVRSYAARRAPEIRLLTGYPVILPDGTVSPPGYHAASGTFYAGPPVVPERDPEAIRGIFDDLLIDYPFEDEQSRHNYVGLLFTPMLRQLLGKAPIHLVTSPQAGTGKSRLIEEVLGVTYLGEELSSSALPEHVEERQKWLIALMLSGETLVHLDNLSDELDSGNLASLVTSRRQSGRLLGASTFLRLENQLVLAATGNNTQLSTELARRTVVVRLVYRGQGRPDQRTRFNHEDSLGYAHERRTAVLASIAGAYLNWREAGSRRGPCAMGSFERWAATIGGVLAHAGYGEHLKNRERWREGTDVEESGLWALTERWHDRHGGELVTAAEMVVSCHEAIQAIIEKPTIVSVGRLLARMTDRTFGTRSVRAGWNPSRNRAYRLELYEGS